jgi:hypothetical protein
MQFDALETKTKRELRFDNRNFEDYLSGGIERIQKKLFLIREKREKQELKVGFAKWKRKNTGTLLDYKCTLEKYCRYYKKSTVIWSEGSKKGRNYKYESFKIENCIIHKHPKGYDIFDEEKGLIQMFTNNKKNLQLKLGKEIKKATFLKYIKA